MKRKNILLIVFMLTLFVFQQVQAGENIQPSVEKMSQTNVPLTWADVVLIRIYPLDMNTGAIVGSKPCDWATYQDGCGQSAPLFHGDTTSDPVECNINNTPSALNHDNGSGIYYYLCIEEDYLPDVLPREINILEIRPPETEALKALAVAARTFVKHKKYWTLADGTIEDRVINNSTEFQVYVPGSRANPYPEYKDQIVSAVTSTSGQYLTYNGDVIDAEFGNDTAGDLTVTSPNGESYLKQVAEPINQSGCRPSTILALGSGWGLSQLGAIRWAKGQTCPEGTNVDWPASGTTSPIKWDYKQILAHYYTGIDIVGTNTPDDR